MSGVYDRSAIKAEAQARDAAVAALVVEGRTLEEVGAMLGVSREYDAARRLFQWRRDRILLAKFAAFAATIGHTPSKGELDHTPGVPCQNQLQQRFGGLQNTARRAGLKPNVIGAYWRGRRRS
jgi:hypothetical protein